MLHVVWDDDQPIARASGERIPCLELRGRIAPKILENYQRLEHERAWIPCQSFFKNIPDIIRLNWLDRLLVERLEQKTAAVAEMLAATENHWEEAFYRLLARNFGLKVNAEPFEALARSLPLLTLAKHKNDAKQVEALLFGQAGFLEETFKDDWPKALAQELLPGACATSPPGALNNARTTTNGRRNCIAGSKFGALVGASPRGQP